METNIRKKFEFGFKNEKKLWSTLGTKMVTHIKKKFKVGYENDKK